MPDGRHAYWSDRNAHELIGGWMPTWVLPGLVRHEWIVPEPPWIEVARGIDVEDPQARVRWELVEMYDRLMREWKWRESERRG